MFFALVQNKEMIEFSLILICIYLSFPKLTLIAYKALAMESFTKLFKRKSLKLYNVLDELLKEDDVSKIEHMETSPKRKTSPIITGKSKVNGQGGATS